MILNVLWRDFITYVGILARVAFIEAKLQMTPLEWSGHMTKMEGIAWVKVVREGKHHKKDARTLLKEPLSHVGPTTISK